MSPALPQTDSVHINCITGNLTHFWQSDSIRSFIMLVQNREASRGWQSGPWRDSPVPDMSVELLRHFPASAVIADKEAWQRILEACCLQSTSTVMWQISPTNMIHISVVCFYLVTLNRCICLLGQHSPTMAVHLYKSLEVTLHSY